jgi:hypothetical protein
MSAMPAVTETAAGGVKRRLSSFAQAPIQQIKFSPVVVAPPSVPSPVKEKYNIDIVMDYDRHFLTVEENITYPNRTNTKLDFLTLAVAPNVLPNCFDLTQLAVNSIPVTSYKLEKQRLAIQLSDPLEPDSALQLTLRYTLSLPYLDQSNNINSPVFGYTDVQANLINWYPFVVPFMNGRWVLHDPWWYGEYLVYPKADYIVNLLFVGGKDVPVVAASGSAEKIVDITRYTLEDGRAFALSISPNFEVSSVKVGETTVSSFYLPAYREAGTAAMEASAQSIELFSEQFGAFPHSTYSIVQASLSESRESSGLSFISRNFYQLYDGTPNNHLTYVSVHSVAHQWWFDQVGNDPAMEPWLDESLATYSEQLYFEHIHSDLLAAWRADRVDFFRPQGEIDTAIYDNINHDIYKQAVYFNGVLFLEDLRQRVGDETFLAFIQDYYIQNRGNIATSNDFFRILDEHTDVNYSDIVQMYFNKYKDIGSLP